MLVSMTGFGRVVRESKLGRLVVELQSVNRKFLEASVFLPREFSRFDVEIRKWVGEKISRGQVTVRVFFTPSEELLSRILPDPSLLARLKSAWIHLAQTAGFDDQDITLPFIIQHMPSSSQTGSDETDDIYMDFLRPCVEEVIQQAIAMKRREGEVLSHDVVKRLNILEELVRQIEGLAPNIVNKQFQKLKERLETVCVPGAELDERIIRELALYADRVDITEEITRFYAHLQQFREAVQSESTSLGRKIDFILQEMGRELNTMGSKSADAAMTRIVVEAKSEWEKVREQIQNIE